MDSAGAPNVGQLESAIAAWNAKLGSAQEPLVESLHLTRHKLETVLAVLTSRRTLSPALLVARIKMNAPQQTPAERAQALQQTLARLALLEETLASFHMELQTLHAQAARAAAAGDVLAEEMLNLYEGAEAAMEAVRKQQQEYQETRSAPASPQMLAQQVESLARQNTRLEAALQQSLVQGSGDAESDALQETELEALRRELAHVRGELEDARKQAASSGEGTAADTSESYDALQEVELEAVRAELGHVREQLEETRRTAAQTQATAREREKKLAARVEALRGELISVRERLRAAEHTEPLEAAAKAEQDSQAELAQLRVELHEMRTLEVQEEPGPTDTAFLERLEKIRETALDAQGRRRQMGQILVEAGVITEEQLERALREQHSAWNRHLGAILVDLGYVTEEAVARALAAQIQAPYIKLSEDAPDSDARALISGQLAHHHTCMPMRLEEDSLVVAMANPFDLVAIEDLELAAGMPVKPWVAAAGDIQAALREYYPQFVRV